MLSSATYAQSKVAHIDFQKLVSEMPSVLAAQEEIQKLEKGLSLQNRKGKKVIICNLKRIFMCIHPL